VTAAPDALPTHAGPFALGTFARDGGPPFAGLVAGDRVRDLRGDLGGGGDRPGDLTVRRLLEDWDAVLPRLGELAASTGGSGTGGGTWLPLAGLEILAPLQPGQVLQSGANYRQHVVDLVLAEHRADGGQRPAAEVRAWAEQMMDDRTATGRPYVFIGLPSAICGPYDDVVLPHRGRRHDWELELAAVIGRPARHVSPADALAHVAGYTICNDLTTRDRVYRPDLKAIGTDWLEAKNAPTFLPTGPWVVPAAFVGDPMDLRITLRHNGAVRQDESTKDMIFGIAELIAYISTIVALRPGDLVLTGSPAGNGAHWGTFLEPGDVMEGAITGLGFQRNRCVAEAAAPAPASAPQRPKEQS